MNQLNPGTNILTSGKSLVSDHVEYLFHMISHANAKGLVNQIAFNQDIPAGQFGSFHGPSRSVCINITAHIAHVFAKIENENPNMSIRALLIIELVNTALHEARHAIYKDEEKNFSDEENDAEELLCQNYADENMWDVARIADLEVQSFGKFLDDEITKFYKELKTAKDTDTFHLWQLSQLNMMEKGILYLDEDKEIVCKTMFELCSYFSKQPVWDNVSVIPFHANQTEAPEEIPTEINIPLDYESAHPVAQSDVPFDINIYLHHAESESLLIETDRQKADEMLNAEGCLQEISKEQYNKLNAEYKTATNTYNKQEPVAVMESGPTVAQHDGYDPLDDCGETELVYPEDLPEMMATPENNTVTTTTTAVAQPTQPAPTGDIRVIAEMVFRRLFTHIYSKCGYDGRGKFTNPGAVLEAVPIDDIAGATQLFQKMDTRDNMGTFVNQAPIQAYVTGLVSKEGLPYYRLYINQNGQLQRRTFIPQNPDKMNTQQQLTSWALKVRDGWRITMLLADGVGIKLDLKTEPNQALGQETFNPWPAK